MKFLLTLLLIPVFIIGCPPAPDKTAFEKYFGEAVVQVEISGLDVLQELPEIGVTLKSGAVLKTKEKESLNSRSSFSIIMPAEVQFSDIDQIKLTLTGYADVLVSYQSAQREVVQIPEKTFEGYNNSEICEKTNSKKRRPIAEEQSYIEVVRRLLSVGTAHALSYKYSCLATYRTQERIKVQFLKQ